VTTPPTFTRLLRVPQAQLHCSQATAPFRVTVRAFRLVELQTKSFEESSSFLPDFRCPQFSMDLCGPASPSDILVLFVMFPRFPSLRFSRSCITCGSPIIPLSHTLSGDHAWPCLQFRVYSSFFPAHIVHFPCIFPTLVQLAVVVPQSFYFPGGSFLNS